MLSYEQPTKVPFGIKRHNRPTAKVSYQQLPRVFPKTLRRKRDSPRRVNRMEVASGIGAGREPAERSSARVIGVNESIARTRNIIFLVRVLLGVGDKNKRVLDGLHIERRVPCRRVEI